MDAKKENEQLHEALKNKCKEVAKLKRVIAELQLELQKRDLEVCV